ncbi:MAG: type II secretion system protein GspK [Bdellovibrionaceae bacterium]|nr:type II secretion system protein GspK [Pseudobdellovibrionaceae bacterium]
MKTLYYRLKQKGGAALLVILAVSSLILPLLQGVWLDSQVDYQFKRYHLSKMQARWNAQSGMGLSLLRLYIFKGIEKSTPKQMISLIRPILDQIWLFPFSWPLLELEDMLESDKDDLENLTKLSFFKGSYSLLISAEDGLFDVNDLSSPLPFLKDFIYDGLFNILWNTIQLNEDLKEKYDQKDIEEILNNLSDWTDLDNESQNGGSETLIEEGKFPLNRSFISIDEIRKVPKVNLEIFEILKPHITTYGAKSLNINYTTEEILLALQFPNGLAEQILLRTQSDSEFYEPFLSQEDFCGFNRDQGFDWCEGIKTNYQSLDMLNFNFPISFRIKSNGKYRNQLVELEGLLYDLSSSALNYQKAVYREQKRQDKKEEIDSFERNQGEDLPQTEKKEGIKFDYSYYKSLVIMFIKENL